MSVNRREKVSVYGGGRVLENDSKVSHLGDCVLMLFTPGHELWELEQVSGREWVLCSILNKINLRYLQEIHEKISKRQLGMEA